MLTLESFKDHDLRTVSGFLAVENLVKELIAERDALLAKNKKLEEINKELVEAGERIRKYHAFIPDAENWLKFEQALSKAKEPGI